MPLLLVKTLRLSQVALAKAAKLISSRKGARMQNSAHFTRYHKASCCVGPQVLCYSPGIPGREIQALLRRISFANGVNASRKAEARNGKSESKLYSEFHGQDEYKAEAAPNLISQLRRVLSGGSHWADSYGTSRSFPEKELRDEHSRKRKTVDPRGRDIGQRGIVRVQNCAIQQGSRQCIWLFTFRLIKIKWN